MEQPSASSKVTVEYFDPSGVYPLLSPGLLPRLPLRNLHWESHAGPLRSISSLHIDLVQSGHDVRPASAADPTPVSTPSLSRIKSQDSTASSDDGFRTQVLGQAAERPDMLSGTVKPAIQGRRHQIPGLRQTPYLKIFLLRCDDNDTYKSTARKQVRDWLKQYTPPISTLNKGTAQENHDAYEWLIVHVIVPNTAASTQPRTSGKGAEGSNGSSEKSATARWRGGGSSTILEKLRADFNGTSKSALDRIAQIRIGINDVPYDMLPRVVPAIPGSYTETPQENENAWLDLISKLKSQILTSFDMRVTQYEEDIREKDGQRLMPGWNFCTFFVLKEGLARGFESVGLVEDALVGYDELAAGLDVIIREQSTIGSGAEHGGSFLPFTEDLKRQFERARMSILRDMGTEEETDDPIDLQSTTDAAFDESVEIPLDASKKGYRELILSNDISVFDFRCYLFARQLSLLLRLANAWSSQEELLAKLKEQRESSLQGVAARLPKTQPSEDVEDLTVLGEVCRRSMAFIASIARIMRDDISASLPTSLPTHEGHDDNNDFPVISDPVVAQVIDNLVSSFTFGIAQQILAQTGTKSLPIPPSTLAPPTSKMSLDGQEPKAAIPEPKTMMHPARSSSLAIRSRSRESRSPDTFPGVRRASIPGPGVAGTSFLKNGLEELAGHRAELYLFSRNILEQVGKGNGWTIGWMKILNTEIGTTNAMEDVDLNDDSPREKEETSHLQPLPHSSYGIDNPLLRAAVSSEEDFYRLYETLTDKALRHYTVATHVQSVHASMADLAFLKYHLGDYAAAASYFYRMTPFYGETGWSQLEIHMLVMYARCLKELARKEEYVRVVLKLLFKIAMVEKERLARNPALQVDRRSRFELEDVLPAESYVPELLEMTKDLHHEVHVPLHNFFGQVEVDGTVQYHSEMDSFSLNLRLQYLLSDAMAIEKVKVRITSMSGDVPREIMLENDGPLALEKGKVQISVHSDTIVPGPYTVTHVSLYTSNVTLHYEHGSTGQANKRLSTFLKCPKLLIYHRPQAFDVQLYAPRYLHLDRNRSLELVLSSGWNILKSGELHVRAATAGLRLQTSEAKVLSGPLEISKKAEAGVVRFGAMPSESTAKLVMPFTLEHDVNELSLKLEISYTTEKGTFIYATTPSISIMLPLGVNVQDVFKHKALFSKFTISSATSSPLRLLSSKLSSSEVFNAVGGALLTRPLVVYPRQPASMMYKITKLTSTPRGVSRKDPKSSLSLVLNYICLEEEVEKAVTRDLHQALKGNPLHPYARLVVPAVVTELRHLLSSYDLERIAILSEVSTSLLSSIRWQDHFSGLGRTAGQNQDVASLIEEWLQAWLQQNPNVPLIPIHIDDEALSNSRSITIPVDVPPLTVVHTADLKLLEPTPNLAATVVAASNQPISTCLEIKWTRIWDTEVPADTTLNEEAEYFEFVYEVSGASDTWLIGGRRKGHFRIPRKAEATVKTRKLSFPVVLIPLREGYLPFPNVDIKPAPIAKPINVGSTGTEEDPKLARQKGVTCETDYKNSGEVIRVISDARKTTVSLDASGPQGGAWLLESERRSLGSGGVVL